MTQNRPPPPSGPTPDESLSARFGGRAPDEAFEDPAGTVAETGSTSETNEVAAGAEQPAPPPDDEGPVAPGGEQTASAGAPSAEEDTRSQEELIAALKAAEAARDEYLEDLRRTQAEFQNFRKR
ncbi:MAG: hypothetical protein M3N32_00885, partial [Actinomycetota bacterium]|nr:hypothetical protein [Actinomycetota bacterium]